MDQTGTHDLATNSPWSRRLVYIVVAVGALLIGLAMRFGLLGQLGLGTATKVLGASIPVYTGPAPSAFVPQPPPTASANATSPPAPVPANAASAPETPLPPPPMVYSGESTAVPSPSSTATPSDIVISAGNAQAAATIPEPPTPAPPLAEPQIRPATKNQPFDVEIII